jgi:hypothetical protein
MIMNTEKNLKLSKENSKKQIKSPNSSKSPNASRSRYARVKKALVALTVPNLKNQKNLVTTTNAQAKKKLKNISKEE